MIGSLHRESSLFYVALGHQASLIKDDLLEPLDLLLDDEELVGLVRERLASRSKLSPLAGREGIAPDRLLRCCVLKHVFEMARARYKGADGFERHVGWSVIANNLVSLARGLVKRRRQEEEREKGNG